VYPCVLSIMCVAGCLFHSAWGRRQVTSMSALLHVCLQTPVSRLLPGNTTVKSRDPSWQVDTSPAIQFVTPSSSSIEMSISVPCSSSIRLHPRSSSYPYSSRRSSCFKSGFSRSIRLIVGLRWGWLEYGLWRVKVPFSLSGSGS